MLITTIFGIFHLGLVIGSALKGCNTRRISLKAKQPSLLKIESIVSTTLALSGMLCKILLTFDFLSWWNIRRHMAIVMFRRDIRTIQSK